MFDSHDGLLRVNDKEYNLSLTLQRWRYIYSKNNNCEVAVFT